MAHTIKRVVRVQVVGGHDAVVRMSPWALGQVPPRVLELKGIATRHGPKVRHPAKMMPTPKLENPCVSPLCTAVNHPQPFPIVSVTSCR